MSLASAAAQALYVSGPVIIGTVLAALAARAIDRDIERERQRRKWHDDPGGGRW